MFTSKRDLFSGRVSIVDETGIEQLCGKVEVTDCLEEACSKANLIFVTVPAFMMGQYAKNIFPFVKVGTMIGLIPGTGGGECAFKPHIEKGCILFGLQRVPSVARLVEYGKCVKATGYRKELHLAAIPHKYTDECCNIVSSIFDMPCIPLPNYLNVTLTPSNPILHTTRLYSLFEDYTDGKTYNRIPLFYEEWSDDASELLFACDAEVQCLCKSIVELDLTQVKSLRLHYESDTPIALTDKLRSIKSLQGIATPSVEIGGRYIPDFQSRYFTADFPYGLSIIVQIAELAGVSVPSCQKVLGWYHNTVRTESSYSYKTFGIVDRKSFVEFYKQ